ncbi:MAG: DNA alkylation repair protein [Candidatus Taylorbacteria bacterium]|nr:DNA alkylation repair protein [Candidatus Taylorbacteria bacterium]
MGQTARAALKKIARLADPRRAIASRWFFKTGKGEYGEGDKFLGVNNPTLRLLSRDFQGLPLVEIKKLLRNSFHEIRQLGLFILVRQFERSSEPEKKRIYDFYLGHTDAINNWDLVDCSAHKIIGAYLWQRDKKILYKLARSKNLWERRIAIISTFYFIKNKKSSVALDIARILRSDKEDIIRKAVGWMLREIGKNCGQGVEEKFLQKYYAELPRVTLRYAIERFPKPKIRAYLLGNFR